MAEAGAASARPKAPRPLSPHLQIFRPYINMVMSIMHRITGGANYAGSLLLAVWLASAAAGDAAYDWVMGYFSSIPGLILLFGYTWSVMHHMLGGIRHMIWDSGHGLDIASVRLLSWGTLLGSLSFTTLIWVVALGLWEAR
jgi:succinate dehydrogenase / fumarate reductase cytochrome b subunit